MGNANLCCCNTIDAASPEKPAPKLRQLLYDLDADFHKFVSGDKLVSSELAAIWKRCAKRRMGTLSEDEVQLIDMASERYLERLDILQDGAVGYDEFMTFMMGGAEERGHMKSFRKQLNTALSKSPEKLKHLIAQFKSWDKNGDGYVTGDELEKHLAEIEALKPHPGEEENYTKMVEYNKGMAEKLLDEADVNEDGKIDLWEFIAHCMGRRKTPVELLVYDISHGAANALGPLLVGRKIEAVHSAVLVFGSEFWFGGKVFRTEPPCEKSFGPPLTECLVPLEPSSYKSGLMVAKIGYTFATLDEFTYFLQEEMVPKYNGAYDLLTHSCNHFSNEVIHFLTGGHVPDKILELQTIALTPTVRALRPFLNKYFGGFAEAGQEFTEDMVVDLEIDPDKLCNSVLGEGDVVVCEDCHSDVDHLGIVVKENDGVYTVKCFDPLSGEMVLKEDVQRTTIRMSSRMLQ